MNNSRREFIKMASTGAALLAAPAILGTAKAEGKVRVSDAVEPFKLKYAPGLGMFRQLAGQDPIDNIKFCYDQGFRAVFDNGLMKREPAVQEKIMNELSRLGMDIGPYVLRADSGKQDFVLNSKEVRDMLIAQMKEGVEVSKRTGAKQALVVLGRYDMKLHMGFQTANAIDNLRYCCDIMEPAGVTIVLEPLNHYINHPGLFLSEMPQAYAICRAVNRPSCKIVEDIYHQQVQEGNLIPNIEACWSEIAAFHCGDNPGRNEPTTGEINYRNIFKYLYGKKYNGTICMEHGISQRGTKEGELRVIQAYRECDSFEI
ncbi:MAG TPA: TIM barrel protein [Bacteroidales bacterium]|jgi:hydroxypyruvate isomerase|nr:TIM barrel protein [Bacteroidales bacterium]